MQLTTIDYSSSQWEKLPEIVRTEVRAWMEYFRNPPTKRVTEWLKSIAKSMGTGYSTARRKYDAYVLSRDWTVLIDNRKLDKATIAIDGTASPAFRAELVKIVGKFQRNNSAAFRHLRHRWMARREAIPGYETWDAWPKMPVGWTTRNLARIIEAETEKARLQSIRIGTSSKTNPFLATVHTTRVGLWPGAVIQWDDQWHDNFVTLGRKRELVRVIELGCLDLFSGDRFHWGAKPRRRTAAGGFENIRTRDMRLFAAGMLHRYGHPANGSMWMIENGTAALPESIENMLYDSTHGLIRLDRQPIEGIQAALSGFWNGTEGGNFRAKACLESTHNVIRNDMAFLPGQTGKDKNSRPVITDRQLAYIAKVVADVFKHVPHREELLKLPLWDFHSQLIPWLTDYYDFGLARRTDHHFEGWEALGHVVNEYTALPGSDHWMSEQDFLQLPEESRLIIGNAARQNPAAWTNRRKLSPREVWNKREDFRPIPPAVICEMISSECAKEVTANNGYLTFHDQEMAPDELIYKAAFFRGPRKGEKIRHGEKVQLFANPFDDSTAFGVDAKGTYLGEFPLFRRVLSIDPGAFDTAEPFASRPDIRSEALKRAAGEKHQDIAELLEPDRLLHKEEIREAIELRAHNKQLLSKDTAVTPEEKTAEKTIKSARAFGKAFRNVTPPPPAEEESFAEVEDYTQLP